MTEGWCADRKLDSEDVRSTLKSQFPELALNSIERLGSGWDFDAYLIDSEFVFRFPRRKEVAAFLENEETVLSSLSPELEKITRLPKIVFRGTPGKWFPYSFFAHRYIKGKAADDPSVQYSPKLATDLGRVLTAIHGISDGLDTTLLHTGARRSCHVRFLETLSLLEPGSRIEETVPDACAWLRNSPVLPLEFGGTPCFIHNDMCPDHIIVDPETGRLEGIIDWSDAAFGDPVWDFVALELWRGREFTESVMSNYGNELDEGFVNRLQFLARTSSIKWLIEVLRQEDGDIEKHVGWVENAFAS